MWLKEKNNLWHVHVFICTYCRITGYQPYSVSYTSLMGQCPIRLVSTAAPLPPPTPYNTLRQSLRARLNWKVAVRRVKALLRARRQWSLQGLYLKRYSLLFDKVERVKGVLRYKR